MINIGDTIYVPWANAWSRVRQPCPMCFGNRTVTVILGNGEHQVVECDFCRLGFQGPRGYVDVFQVESGIREHQVCGFVQDHGQCTKYFISTNNSFDAHVVYMDRTDAEQRRAILEAEARAAAQHSFESQFKNSKRKLAWTIGYHRAQIAGLKRKLQWHEDKLRAKEVTKNETKP